MQANERPRWQPSAYNVAVFNGSREAAKAQRGQGLPHNLCAFAASREILSIGYIKNRVPAFAGMTDGIGPIHD
jgi:hypothetical protein